MIDTCLLLTTLCGEQIANVVLHSQLEIDVIITIIITGIVTSIIILLMTRNQVSVTRVSHCVPKILTLHGMSKIDFQPDFWNSQMLSFPNMYNTMGSKVDGLAVRDHFLSKSA